MKILVVGSGGREHAIAWRLAQDQEKHEIYCVPGNAGTLDVAVNVAIGGFHISVHTKAADDDTFIRLAKQIVVVVGLLLRRFKTTLVIGVHAALLAFGEFIFTQSYRLLVAPDGQNIYDTRNCGSI